MNKPPQKNLALARLHNILLRTIHSVYYILIEPYSQEEDRYRREFIFNIIILTVISFVCLLDISVWYAHLEKLNSSSGFSLLSFSCFILVFGSLLAMSRKGYSVLASYFFIGIYFLATTFGIYTWGIELPLAVLSYSIIIVMSGVLIGTRFSFGLAAAVSGTMIVLGYLQTRGVVLPDLSWRSESMTFKDTVEHSIIYMSIGVVSWLSNREIERSLIRARTSEKALKEERDQLERKVEERTLDLKSAQLEKVSQLYRFAEFGRLASGIFHDLLNPLTAVSLTIEKIGEETDTRNLDTKEQIAKAVRASRRMESFMQTVRKHLQSESSEKMFSPASEIKDAIDILTHKAKTLNVEIRVNLDTDFDSYGCPNRFFQVAVNLISNAIDSYTGFKPEDLIDRFVEISLSSNRDSFRLKVVDRGSGIKPEIQEFIFNPFFTTKSEHIGIGLGLSTTKQIVEKYFNGEIHFESAVDAGSTFIVDITKRKPSSRAYGKKA